jgi:transposase-like protein
MRKNLSIKERKTIIDYYNEGKHPQNISEFLKIPIATVYRPIKRFKNSECIERMQNGGDLRSVLTHHEKYALSSGLKKMHR